METITIRQANGNDLEQLLTFEQGVITAERPFDPTLKDEKISYYDLKSMLSDPTVHVVVAVMEDEIIASGYARILNAKPFLNYETYAYLGFMFVKAQYRGKGINQKILDALKEWSLSKGLTEMRLEVYAENTPAIKAYEKAGFSNLLIEMRMPIKE